jgi:hypothetical protein
MENAKLEKALQWIIPLLEKNTIPYQISGGFAAHLYGATRPINDIDIDIPEMHIKSLAAKAQKYIVLGPKQFKDKKWDLYLVTLNYHGQEIDIGSAENARIYDEQNGEWAICPANLETALPIIYNGMQLQVVAPKDLVKYKTLLATPDHPHQKTDILATQQYTLKTHK